MSSSLMHGHTFGFIDIACLSECLGLSWIHSLVIISKSLFEKVLILGGAHSKIFILGGR